MGVFDVVGPNMIGSSSHTAGAAHCPKAGKLR